MLTFAQFEREPASERIRDKFTQRAQHGLYNGGRPPFQSCLGSYEQGGPTDPAARLRLPPPPLFRNCGVRRVPFQHERFVHQQGHAGRPSALFFYRCTATNHKGWNSCSTRQISASRLDETIHRGLLRLASDPIYLKLILQQPPENGIEPLHKTEGLTPEILQKSLQEHVRNSARKTGMEKTLKVRERIEKVVYGKERVTVRFRWGLAPDGERPEVMASSSVARCTASAFASTAPAQKKESNPELKLDPFEEFDSKKWWS